MFFITLSVVLMVCDHRYYPLRQLRAQLTLFVAPIQYAVNFPLQFFHRIGSNIIRQEKLITENRALHAEQLLLKARVQKLMALEQENAHLRALLQSAPRVSEKVLAAGMLAVQASPFAQEIILDKGAKQGVFLGQPVLDADGIMGQIIEVNPLTSRMMLITDKHSAVPVMVNRNGFRAIVIGDLDGEGLKLIHVPQTTDIQVGDILVTSGLGQRYPAGYPVGRITKVIRDPGYTFLRIAVSPSADIHRARNFLLAWPGSSLVEKNETVMPAQSASEVKASAPTKQS